MTCHDYDYGIDHNDDDDDDVMMELINMMLMKMMVKKLMMTLIKVVMMLIMIEAVKVVWEFLMTLKTCWNLVELHVFGTVICVRVHLHNNSNNNKPSINSDKNMNNNLIINRIIQMIEHMKLTCHRTKCFFTKSFTVVFLHTSLIIRKR